MSELVIVPLSELRELLQKEIQSAEDRIVMRLSGNRVNMRIAMDILNISSPTTFLKLVNSGKIKAYRNNPNGNPHYLLSEVREFAESYTKGRQKMIANT